MPLIGYPPQDKPPPLGQGQPPPPGQGQPPPPAQYGQPGMYIQLH